MDRSLRLASLHEWQDAGDGQLGEGDIISMGIEKDDSQCVMILPSIHSNGLQFSHPALSKVV